MSKLSQIANELEITREEAKAALEKSNGSVEKALQSFIEDEEEGGKMVGEGGKGEGKALAEISPLSAPSSKSESEDDFMSTSSSDPVLVENPGSIEDEESPVEVEKSGAGDTGGALNNMHKTASAPDSAEKKKTPAAMISLEDSDEEDGWD